MSRRISASAALTLLISSSMAQAVTIAISSNGKFFTLDGVATYLNGASYYANEGISTASFRTQDLDDLVADRFNWVRAWCYWTSPVNGESFAVTTQAGAVREPYMTRLKTLITECNNRGMIVDVTMSHDTGGTVGPSTLAQHVACAQTIANQLISYRNVYIDIANERDVGDGRFVSIQDCGTIINAIKAIDPSRVCTASGTPTSQSDMATFKNTGHLDFIAPHLCRDAGCSALTVGTVNQFVGWMAASGFRIPVHLQEPFRRDYQAYNPVEDDFYRDDTGAKIAEAAGWCWHNGSGPVVYRSFLMDDARGRLYSQIDSVEVNVTNNSYDRIGALNTNARRYHAEYSEQLSHQIGRQEGSVWSANTAQDATGYLVYGPYIDTVPSGNHSADWRLSIDNNTANNEAVLGLDVYSNGQTLAGRTVTRQEFTAANTFQTFSLNFTSTGQQDLEFRVYWLDKAYIKCDWVQLNMSQTTYSGTPNIPGTVQAENFDNGGEGVAYHDLSGGNYGGQFRSTDVDIEGCTDTGGGFDIGFIDTSEWIEYTVNVTSAGSYNINMRTASPNNGCAYHLDMNGVNVTGTRTLPNTGGWQTWTTTTASNISLSAGTQVMRVYIESGAWNFNYVDIQSAGGGLPAYFTNSNFENGFVGAGGGYNGSVGTGWTPYTYTGVPADLTFSDETNAANVNSGSHSQKIQAGAGKEGGVYNRFGVTNGNTYTVTVRAKSGSPTGWLWFGINSSGGTDAHEATGTFYPMENNRSTNWITFTWTGQATGNAITLFLDTYDGVGYWDTATPASPGGPVTISNSTFASSADGWNIVVWHSGPYNDGTMAFESGTGNPAGDMLSGAAGATNNNDSCNREGGEINKAISTSGYNTSIQVQYDLRFNTDQTGPGCAGSCTVLEGTCADKLAVYYSTAGTGGPWTLLEAIDASALTQNVWSTRTINCPAAANNKPNFALRFRFQFNSNPPDNGRLDNIKVIGTP